MFVGERCYLPEDTESAALRKTKIEALRKKCLSEEKDKEARKRTHYSNKFLSECLESAGELKMRKIDIGAARKYAEILVSTTLIKEMEKNFEERLIHFITPLLNSSDPATVEAAESFILKESQKNAKAHWALRRICAEKMRNQQPLSERLNDFAARTLESKEKPGHKSAKDPKDNLLRNYFVVLAAWLLVKNFQLHRTRNEATPSNDCVFDLLIQAATMKKTPWPGYSSQDKLWKKSAALRNQFKFLSTSFIWIEFHGTGWYPPGTRFTNRGNFQNIDPTIISDL
ncbi:MAG: hypothetical protein WA081_05280 [Desulfosalsimonadaceae bacterium]